MDIELAVHEAFHECGDQHHHSLWRYHTGFFNDLNTEDSVSLETEMAMLGALTKPGTPFRYELADFYHGEFISGEFVTLNSVAIIGPVDTTIEVWGA